MPHAHQQLLGLVYDELRQMARRHRAQWRKAPLGTQSLVHEAYLKLVDQTHVQWQSRGQFFAIASHAMRSILIDNARHWQRLKREGGRERVELDEGMLVSEARSEELLVARRRARKTAAGRRAAGVDRRVPVLRRADGRGDRRGAGPVAGDGEARLGGGADVALSRAARRLAAG